jgi:hypothetical protein
MAYFKSGDGSRGTAQLNQALKMDSSLPEAATAQRMAAGRRSGRLKCFQFGKFPNSRYSGLKTFSLIMRQFSGI